MRLFKSRITDPLALWNLLSWDDYDGSFAQFTFLETPWFAVSLNFHTDANPPGQMHDHPWSFVAFVLSGSYTEVTGTVDGDRLINTHYRHVDFMAKRRHDEPHGIVGVEDGGCTTLMFSGPPSLRQWLYYDCLDTPGSGDVRYMKRLP